MTSIIEMLMRIIRVIIQNLIFTFKDHSFTLKYLYLDLELSCMQQMKNFSKSPLKILTAYSILHLTQDTGREEHAHKH